MNQLLKTLKAYKHPDVILRFKQRYPQHADIAEQLFEDLMCYLWLCSEYDKDKAASPNQSELNFTPVMHEEMRLIDDMWHEFILMTRDYTDFCQKYFGKFLHHQVNMKRVMPEEKTLLAQTENFFHYIYDRLGEDVLRRWFKEHLLAS